MEVRTQDTPEPDNPLQPSQHDSLNQLPIEEVNSNNPQKKKKKKKKKTQNNQQVASDPESSNPFYIPEGPRRLYVNFELGDLQGFSPQRLEETHVTFQEYLKRSQRELELRMKPEIQSRMNRTQEIENRIIISLFQRRLARFNMCKDVTYYPSLELLKENPEDRELRKVIGDYYMCHPTDVPQQIDDYSAEFYEELRKFGGPF